ncbi:MAG: hypothetical protein LBS64_00405 [Spirochaetaceae bacterium]|jgi:hypothetical protein|nr:hypothetical protein [Spirochaetaceae bacterium]
MKPSPQINVSFRAPAFTFFHPEIPVKAQGFRKNLTAKAKKSNKSSGLPLKLLRLFAFAVELRIAGVRSFIGKFGSERFHAKENLRGIIFTAMVLSI